VHRRRLITIGILSLWVLAGPLILMCSSHCGSMGTACANLCAPVPGVLSTLSSLTLLTYCTVPLRPFSHSPTALIKVPTPPPKDVSFSV
jgi:hypothetical protein